MDSCSWPLFWRSRVPRLKKLTEDHSSKLDIGCRDCRALHVFLILPCIQIYHAATNWGTGQRDSGWERLLLTPCGNQNGIGVSIDEDSRASFETCLLLPHSLSYLISSPEAPLFSFFLFVLPFFFIDKS